MSIEAIKEALKAGPTEGPWLLDGQHVSRAPGFHLYVECLQGSGGKIVGSPRANAAFIAACNPAAIRALIERLEAAEKDAARLDWLTKQFRAMSLDMGGNHCWVLARSGSIRGPNMIAAIDSAMSGGLAEGVSDA